MFRIDESNRFDSDLIAEAHCYCVGPFIKLRSCPFESMIAVAHLARWKAGKQDVVFAIGSCDNNVGGRANSNSTRSSAISLERSRCSITSTNTAASKQEQQRRD